jgi:adenylate cyclase
MSVALDEALHEEFGGFLFRLTDLGKLAEILSGFGARVVGLDFLMDFRSFYGEDEPTADMLRAANDVFLVSSANFEDEKFTGLTCPAEILNQASVTGYTNLELTSAIVNSLGRFRIHKDIAINKHGWPYAVQVVAMYCQVEPRLEGSMLELGDRLRAPLDQFGHINIDFPLLDADTRHLCEGAARFFALENFELDNVTAEETEEWQFVFGDKIVLVGDTWELTYDEYNDSTGSVYRVEIIADAIGTMMNGLPTRPASRLVESLVTAFFCRPTCHRCIDGPRKPRNGRDSCLFCPYRGSRRVLCVSGSGCYHGIRDAGWVSYPDCDEYAVIYDSGKSQLVSAADSAESSRMLGLVY